MSEITGLVTALRSYGQADEDGVMCIVSRQACEEAADELERLTTALENARKDAWQPIETAPKDSEFFLASSGGLVPFVTAWDDEDQVWFTFNRCYENTIQKRTGKSWAPTHWQPLPEPPSLTPPTEKATWWRL